MGGKIKKKKLKKLQLHIFDAHYKVFLDCYSMKFLLTYFIIFLLLLF